MSQLFKKEFPEFENPIEIRIPRYRNKNFEHYQHKYAFYRERYFTMSKLYIKKK